MKRAVLIVVLALSACQSEGDNAEERYKIVKANGDNADEICAAARSVANAYLDARDAKQYQRWKLTADLDCNEAALQRMEN